MVGRAGFDTCMQELMRARIIGRSLVHISLLVGGDGSDIQLYRIDP